MTPDWVQNPGVCTDIAYMDLWGGGHRHLAAGPVLSPGALAKCKVETRVKTNCLHLLNIKLDENVTCMCFDEAIKQKVSGTARSIRLDPVSKK